MRTQRIRAYLKMLRVRDWLGYFLISILGYILSTQMNAGILDTLLFLVLVSFYLGFSFSINNCFDVKEDSIEMRKNNPIVTGELGQRGGIIFSTALALIGMLLALLHGLNVFLFYSVLIFLSFSYSSPPLRLKSRPFLDLVSHGLFFGSLLFLFPFMFFPNKEVGFLDILIAISIFYFSVILELRNGIEDYDSDREAGLRTTVCVLGLSKSIRLARSLALLYPLVLSPIYCMLDNNFLQILFLIITMLFYLAFYRIKSYRVLDFYANISYSLIALGVIV